jgi:ankyrin repeat protein
MKENFVLDTDGRTPLFYACKSGDMAMVQIILSEEAGTGIFPSRLSLIEKKDNNGLKAADVAEQNNHLEIAELLRDEESRMYWSE